MKKTKPLFFCFFLLLPLLGCEELEELIEEEFDVSLTFEGDLNITSRSSVSDISDPISIRTETASYNIAADPEVAEVIGDNSEVKKIKINRIRYSYIDFEGNEEAVVVEGGFSFRLINNIERTIPITDTGVNVAEADFRNDVFTIEEGFGSIEEGFNENFQTVLISYFGTLSHNPVDFKVGITVDVTVTIKPDVDNF